MQIRKLTPNLMVEDVLASVEFYTSLLGFELVMTVNENQIGNPAALPADGPLAFALVRNGNIELMFQSRKSMGEDIPVLHDKAIGATVSIYLETDGIEASYDSIRSKVGVVKELFTTWYGMREFYFTDNDGYVLCLAEQAK